MKYTFLCDVIITSLLCLRICSNDCHFGIALFQFIGLDVQFQFSIVYKAIWSKGPPYWNEEKEDFEYKDYNMMVALKQLKNSKNITLRELNEVLYIILIKHFSI